MCNKHDEPDLSRRHFTTLGLAAGAALSLIPIRASAKAKIDALCIMCIDYRLVDEAIHFFDGHVGKDDYDLVALAGASLAGVGPAFPTSVGAFWNHIDIAKQLHDISRVVILDHRECGAYEVQYGSLYQDFGVPELEQHREIMKLVKAEFERRRVGLPVEFWLMPVKPPGPPVPVTIGLG
jgi:carbonic anhydrase-like protein